MGNPLYQTVSGTVDANGDITLFLAGPGSGRVWQGTISITRGPLNTQFEVIIGGQQMGYVNSPGPGGPYQIFSNNSINLVASGALTGSMYTAILSGVDDPMEGATPYTGPIAVTSLSTGSP